MQASNSPNGRSVVDFPRRGDSYGQVSIAESRPLSQDWPASSTITSAPAWVSMYAAMPPPAPEPTMQTSYTRDWGLEYQGVRNSVGEMLFNERADRPTSD